MHCFRGFRRGERDHETAARCEVRGAGSAWTAPACRSTDPASACRQPLSPGSARTRGIAATTQL